MAVTQNTLIGRSSGSVGGVTFATWKGLNIMKSKAVSVANPDTIAQQKQRNKMALIVGIYRLISSIVQVGFKTQAVGKSEYNAFVSDNIKTAISADSSAVATLDPELLTIAKGTIGVVEIDDVTQSGPEDFAVNWTDTIPVGGASSDFAYALAYDPTADVFVQSTASSTRADETITISFPTGSTVSASTQFYLFFKSASSENVSDSVTEQGFS